jgi:hypothetical protein
MSVGSGSVVCIAFTQVARAVTLAGGAVGPDRNRTDLDQSRRAALNRRAGFDALTFGWQTDGVSGRARRDDSRIVLRAVRRAQSG